MYATSNSARPPAARSLAMVWTELPSTYLTVDPVAFSNAVAWHFRELSTKVPPKVATTSSSANTGAASAAVRRQMRQINRASDERLMVGGSSRGACWRDYSRAASNKSTADRARPTLDAVARAEDDGHAAGDARQVRTADSRHRQCIGTSDDRRAA